MICEDIAMQGNRVSISKIDSQRACPILVPPFAVIMALIVLAAVSQAATWQPPIGIPAPDFGMSETYRMYDGPSNRNPDLTYSQNAEGGYYTHYIDNADPNATDSNNPYGTEEKPRTTIPTNIPEGSVVEIHNSVSGTSLRYITASGSIGKPIFVRGYSFEDKPLIQHSILVKNAYSIWENLELYKATFQVRPHAGSNAHHVSFRSSETYGDGTLGSSAGVQIWGASGSLFHNIVIYNNHIHHGGDSEASVENDRHGVGVGAYMEDIWIVDNHIHHMGGDSVQVSHGANFTTQRVYIGRNVLHDDRENAVDIKEANYVFVSENEMYGYEPCSSAPGEAAVVHYDPHDIYWLYNRIHDSVYGIVSTGSREQYIIGNIIYNIAGSGTYSTDYSPHRPGIGIRWYNTGITYVVNNTLYNCITGIGADILSYPTSIVNNIFSSMNETENGYHLTIMGTGRGASAVKNSLFYQPNGEAKIYWGTTYNVAEFQAATGNGEGCMEADPQFIDAATNDFRLQPGSPAINAGTSSGVVEEVFDRFETLYGIDIRKDIEGAARSEPWDIGAYELDLHSMCDTGPAAWWKMDDNADSATVAEAIDIASYDGVARSFTSMLSTGGIIDSALTFDGSNDYISVPEAIEWTLDGDFTFTLWVRFDSLNPNWWESAFLAQDEGGGPHNKWIFSYDPTSHRTLFHINGPGIGGHMLTGDQWTAQAAAWYFVGLSRSGDTYTFYRQGVADGSQVNSTAIPDVSSALTIGWAEGPARFDGAIDDVRIYCRTLTALEVEAVCNEGPSAHWKMDDNAASKTVVDIIGRGNDGAARQNTEYLTVSGGMIDNALSFNGTTDYIAVPAEGLNTWLLAVDFTISLWVKYDAFNSNWWESALLAQDQGGGKHDKWIFSYDPTSEQTLFHINGPASTGPVITGDPWTAEAGRWYFIAISRSSDGTYNFYRQGASNGSEVNTETIPDVSAPWTIGWGEGAGRFDGIIDDVRVYNRVLSQAEISDLYDEGTTSGMPEFLAHWAMDDNASNTAVLDSSENENDGTARRNTSDLSTAGIISTALSFNGTTDYVSVPDQAAWSFSGDFTIALWVKYDLFNPKWWESAFLAQDAGGGPTNKWIFSYSPTSEKTLFHINGPGTGAPILTGNQWSAQTDTWYFVGLSRTGDTYTFYRQGIADGSDTAPLTSSYSGTVGNETVFSSVTTNGNRRAMPFVMPEAGTLESITMYHEGGTGNVLLGVYTGAGLPEAMIAVTASTPLSSVAGWQTIDLISPVEVAAGETIWLAWVFESNPGIRFQTGTPGRASSPAGWSGGMPATFGDSSTADYVYSIYATYTGGGTDTVTIPDVAAPLTIGWAEGPGKFDGAIDDVRIYNEALSPAKMQVLYNAGAGV